MNNYYKLYIKGQRGYENAEIYSTKQQLVDRIAALQEEYLIIWHHDDMDDPISYKPCSVTITDKVKSNIKVKATTFTTESLKHKKTKKQKCNERKKQDYNDFKDYLDR